MARSPVFRRYLQLSDMAIHGIEKHHEMKRIRILRDTAALHEQVLEVLASLPAVAITYVCLVFLLVVFPAIFDIVLDVRSRLLLDPPHSAKPDIPFRKRQSLHEIDHSDIHPKTKKPREARGILHVANRKPDNAEVWLADTDAKTHFFFSGSTGAGKPKG